VAALQADVEVLKSRCAGLAARTRAADRRVLAIAAQARTAQAGEVAALALVRRIQEEVWGQLVEPPSADGCQKIRFHREGEAVEFAEALAAKTGEPVAAYNAYPCQRCPRSPVTVRRYYHVGHVSGSAAAEAARKAEHLRRTADAHRGGRLVEQRVDPAVLARLRQVARRGPTR
jgi:hypothetical protein